MIKKIFICAAIFFLYSCAASPVSRLKTADDIAFANKMAKTIVRTRNFDLTTYSRIANKEEAIVFYVEGDGLAFLGKRRISADPTPLNPMGLRLASLDHSENVVYIARPCQYLENNTNRNCSTAYWTDKRFALEVVLSINEVISHFAKDANKVHLVGYSGGGAIVTILSAMRDDVETLRTIAGNLNHEAVNKHHNVPPQKGSLNPINYLQKIRNIPQIHYVGEKDKIVPPFIAENVVSLINNNRCAEVETVAKATHSEGWQDFWKENYHKKPSC